MKSLTVRIRHARDLRAMSYRAVYPADSSSFPIRVEDPTGGVLSEGVAGEYEPLLLTFADPESHEVLYVKLLSPNGRSVVQRVHYGPSTDALVQFVIGSADVPDWARWASPRVASKLVQSSEISSSARGAISRFRNVWVKLWRFDEGSWRQVAIAPSEKEAIASAKQIELNLQEGSHLLQLGSASLPWFFVALPARGVCRVLLTPQRVMSTQDIPLQVVLTSSRPEAETLLEFLSRDELGAAGSIATYLLERKYEDPTSAIAGAYYLLRSGGWREIPIWWFDNLYASFPWSSDAALILLVVSLRRGLTLTSEIETAYQMLSEVLTRGLPMFAEAHRLMLEASTVLDQARRAPEDEGGAAMTVRLLAPEGLEATLATYAALAAARAEMGSAFAFYGDFPDRPSANRQTGAAPERCDSPEAGENDFEPLQTASLELGFTSSGNARRARARRVSRKTATLLKDL